MRHAGKLECRRPRAAVAELVRAFEPQHLLDRSLHQLRMLDQPLALARPTGKSQRVQRIADEVGRGLVAGVEDEDAVLLENSTR